MRLTNKDYVSILKYYNKPIPKSQTMLKKQAESIMNLKLCKCIKKIDPVNEAKSIGICTKTIFNNELMQSTRCCFMNRYNKRQQQQK